MTRSCEHFGADLQLDPPLDVCASCVDIGATWFHLRQCLTCGRTSCCNASPNRHATAHFDETGHPMIRAVQADEDWQWCYVDDRLYLPGRTDYEIAEA
ncbi:MAG TPA: UBP-type zinc finger domain-containing protein [Candidatus Limnocylindrales bacterium]